MLGASYKTKKALKESKGEKLKYVETSMFGPEYNPNMQGIAVVGPCPYTKRNWFAQVWLTDGIIRKVT